MIAESIDIDDSSGSKANVGLIQNLHKIGYQITVLHYTRKEITLKGVKTIAIREKKNTLFYLLSRAQRVFQRIFNINTSRFFENFFGLSFTYYNDSNSMAASIREHYKGEDMIITLSKGASFRPHHALLKLPQFHDKWLAYVHDPYPFHFYPPPYEWKEAGYKKKEAFFREVSEKAKYSAFPSQLLLEWMGKHFPNFLITGIVIPHQASTPEGEHPPLPHYFEPARFNLLHAGNLMKQRSPEGLLKGFELFLKNHPEAKNDARLFLLGPASYHKPMLLAYEKSISGLYVDMENIPFDVVNLLQQKSSVNIILEAKASSSPFLPGKFPHCVQANRPILLLGPQHSETKRLLGNNHEYWGEVDDVLTIQRQIKKLYALWQQDPDGMRLDRKDLEEYLSADYLKKTIENMET